MCYLFFKKKKRRKQCTTADSLFFLFLMFLVCPTARPLAVTVCAVYSYVWGIFSSGDISSVLHEERTSNRMDNSVSKVGRGPE